MKLGTGVWESAKFNSRLQVTELSAGRGPSSGSIWKMTTEYGELQTNGTVDLTKNSGNIGKQTVSFDGLTHPFVQTFAYDALQRLTEAKETSNSNQTWKQVFDYDRYGNRIIHNKWIGTSQTVHDNKTYPAIDSATNRFQGTQGFTFDANGNITIDPEGRRFTFNGDNKQTEVRDAQNNLIGQYSYDGEGKRIKKVTVSETTIFVYSGSKLIAEYSTAAPPPNPTTRYTITDQLGSPRVILDSTGDVLSRRDFLPFGEEIDPDGIYRRTDQKFGQTDNVRQKFTGYQNDEETGLDFAEARMYENRHGRFTAVDPLLSSGKSGDPQTFNRYVYVMNSSVNSYRSDRIASGRLPGGSSWLRLWRRCY
ncbi:MAG: RHS repeat-associated core domain-containing protein [Pyrinomonadaceae bacterium]